MGGMLSKLICKLFGHNWQNDTIYPVTGFYSIPEPGSICLRCHKQVPEDV